MAANEAENLAKLVARGFSIRDAAAELGLSDNVAYKLTCKPEFKLLVSSLRVEIAEGRCSRLEENYEAIAGLNPLAIQTIQDVMQNAEKDSDRLNAAKLVFTYQKDIADQIELRRRIEQLERGVDEAGESTGAEPS